MTGKPHYFALQYDTFRSLYQTGFGTHLKNAVPNTLAFRCISVDCVDFCEGCESKKCKNLGCARTRTRARGGKDENLVHSKWFSEVRFILLQASNKNIGHFPITWEVFPKTWEVFQYISHVFSLRPDTLQVRQERFVISRPTSSTAGAWLCPVIPISRHTKGSAKEECGVKTDDATTVHPETTKLGRLQSEKRWR